MKKLNWGRGAHPWHPRASRLTMSIGARSFNVVFLYDLLQITSPCTPVTWKNNHLFIFCVHMVSVWSSRATISVDESEYLGIFSLNTVHIRPRNVDHHCAIRTDVSLYKEETGKHTFTQGIYQHWLSYRCQDKMDRFCFVYIWMTWSKVFGNVWKQI